MGRPRHRPWGIHTIASMIGSPSVSSEMLGGILPSARAVPEPYWTFGFERLRAAWWVLTGRAHAVVWPKPGDLEQALNREVSHEH